MAALARLRRDVSKVRDMFNDRRPAERLDLRRAIAPLRQRSRSQRVRVVASATYGKSYARSSTSSRKTAFTSSTPASSKLSVELEPRPDEVHDLTRPVRVRRVDAAAVERDVPQDQG